MSASKRRGRREAVGTFVPTDKNEMVKAKASVFIDYRNYHYYLEKHAWEIDWERFKKFLHRIFDVIEIYFYEGMASKAVFFHLHRRDSIQDFIDMKEEKKEYFNSLRQQGFKVRKKLIGRIYDERTKEYKLKCNFDVELTIDAIGTLDNYEVCVLCSGDGDFIKLIRYLKGKRKRVIVMAGEDRLSRGSKKAANQVIYLKNIKRDIEDTS